MPDGRGAKAGRTGRSSAADGTDGGRGSDGAGRLPSPVLQWRLRVDDAASAADNMAIDHALALAVEDGEAVDVAILRLYRWARPTISLGRNQPGRGRFDLRRAEREGVEFVRRPTGGRAVLHHEELTYAVIVPVAAFGGLRPSYRRINEALVAGLEVLGIPAALATPGGRALAPDAGPCFRDPAAGEVVAVAGRADSGSEGGGEAAAARKLAGSAQLRIGRTLLQHGSLPLSRSQALLDALSLPGDARARRETHPLHPGSASAGSESGSEAAPGASRDAGAPNSEGVGGLRHALGRDVPWESAAAALRAGFLQLFPGEWQPLDEGVPRQVVVERLRSHYASSEWTWRI